MREDRGGRGSGRCGEPDAAVCELLLLSLVTIKLPFVDKLSSTEPLLCSERMAASMLKLVMRVSGFSGLMIFFKGDDVALGELAELPMVLMDDLPLASEYRVPCILLVLMPVIS